MSIASRSPDAATASRTTAPAGAGCLWYVEASARVWGPYPEARMASFIGEGRVTPETAVSPFAAGPFAAAAEQVEFAPLFKPAHAGPVETAAPAEAVQPPTVVDQARRNAAAAPIGPLRPLLVWATLATVAPTAFAAALKRYGAARQIDAGLWLVQAAVTAAALRNDLSRGLGAGDVLVVAEASLENAAWFNLDPSTDRELRRLWTGATGR